jgi:Transposase, Mutator family
LIRNTFRLTSRKYWDEIKRDVKPIYTAVNAAAARSAFDELADKWGQRYPAVIRLWDNAWSEFIPFLHYDVEIRRVICTTNSTVIWSAARDRGCDLHVCFVEGVYDAPGDGCRCRSARPDRYRTEMGRFVAPARVVAELAEGACELAA